MIAPLSEQQLAEIAADLAAVPAPPWRWIGNRGSGGPQLVTDHSGRQYLLRAAFVSDSRGDEVLDPDTDLVIFGDLVFRDQRPGEKYSTMRPGNTLAIGRTEYDPDSIVGVDNPVARWVERSAAHATALLAEVERQAKRIAELEGITANAEKLYHEWLTTSAEHISISTLKEVRETPLLAGMQEGRANQYSDCANELRDVLDGEDPDNWQHGVSVEVATPEAGDRS